MKKLQRLIASLILVASALSGSTASAADTMILSNDPGGSLWLWGQGVSELYIYKITGAGGYQIKSIKSAFATNISTDGPATTVYLFNDNSGAPGTVAATFTYSSNDGTRFATYTGNYTVPAGGVFWIGQSAASYLNVAGTGSTNSLSNGVNISMSPRYYATSTSGPFTSQTTTSSPLWQLYAAGNDTTAPTFVSGSSFSVQENISTTSTAATIDVSESATIAISGGLDSSLFNISVLDTDTALIKFKSSPDFEAPADNGSNNVYNITLSATDPSGNVGAQSIAITVTDVVDTSSINSIGLSGPAKFRTLVQINVNVSVPARVSFKVNSKRIAGCTKILTSGTSPNIVATCNWKPSIRGVALLTASAIPTGNGITSSNSSPINVQIGNRSGNR